ncbi:MAG: UDP-4-amino-4,6-dideoxy-N-acetyl-beta-L-altrosamine transaminase [Candidatus Peribacteraceae bacterium]|nr:UDP-4-amino-4,6-dideoxy-N-acetyl-beta-L-altrosamine transaminase [Candidatus Peribacteraceae bacterium]
MQEKLAIDGGTPVREKLLPYSRQTVSDDDIRAMEEVLRSDWLTTGPTVGKFEEVFASFTGAKEAIAVSNGTAALHAAMFALGVRKGDEVIVPTMTFASTANAIVFQGGTPVFVDSEPDTLLIDPTKVEEAITEKTKAIISVDYAGQPCEYEALRTIAREHNLPLVDDACHAIGGLENGKRVGTLADINTFSFHAVKPIATGEGGMITTDNEDYAKKMRQFRNHGLTSDHRERQERGSWFYEMTDLGYNYRLTDFQCALGMSQLKNVPKWTKRRQEIAGMYDEAFAGMSAVTPLKVRDNVSHAYHLYVVRLGIDRTKAFEALRAENIGVNVHYIPVHLHPFYQRTFCTKKGMFPVAEKAYEEIISLPLFTGMTDDDAQDIVEAVRKVCTHYAK